MRRLMVSISEKGTTRTPSERTVRVSRHVWATVAMGRSDAGRLGLRGLLSEATPCSQTNSPS